MTIGEWLATRSPAPPPQLLHRVRAALGGAIADDASLVSDRCIDVAERIVAQLLHDGRTGRDSAEDLLTADALVTYAFEAASDDPTRLAERAHEAMVRFARLGAGDAQGDGGRGATSRAVRQA
jgi:hypothetical protein